MTPEAIEFSPAPDAPEATKEEKVEAEVRCKFCDKFITKVIVTVDALGPGAKQKVVKVGHETKCPRCKQFVYHVFVV